MDDFEYSLPTHLVFGHDAEGRVGELVAAHGGSRVLVLYGGGSCVRSGLLDRVCAALEDAGVVHAELGGVAPNPLSDLVYRGIEAVRADKLDFVLAIGGGSVIDTAKAVALGAPYEGDFWDFYGGDAEPERALPVGVVLTMAASGSEASPDSVITQAGTMLKRETSSRVLLPAFSVLDPALTETLPAYQTACGIVDMYSHVLERYFTRTEATGVTDRMIEGLMLAIIDEAPRVMADPKSYDARANLMWAATMAHCDVAGVGRTQDWASHDIEYALSSRYGVAHGAGLAIVMPAVERYYLDRVPASVPRLAQLARRVWGVEVLDGYTAAALGIERQCDFFASLGMPATLADIGGGAGDIAALAHETCWAGGRRGRVGGYAPFDERPVTEVFRLMLPQTHPLPDVVCRSRNTSLT